jgi:hypothetical protein
MDMLDMTLQKKEQSLTASIKIICETLAVLGAIIGSSIIALNLGHNQYGYVSFMISGAAQFYLLKDTNVSKTILLINGFYFTINIVGLYNY